MGAQTILGQAINQGGGQGEKYAERPRVPGSRRRLGKNTHTREGRGGEHSIPNATPGPFTHGCLDSSSFDSRPAFGKAHQ